MKIYDIEIEPTADGSVTLYRKDINEHYHSVKGAMTESGHVYLGHGWEMAAAGRETVSVFEVGFGTGLNAALTASAAQRLRKPTKYFSVELYPLSRVLTDRLEYGGDEGFSRMFRAVNEAAWDSPAVINDFFTLHKIEGDLLSMNIPSGMDVVYFDAFAPEKQPEMWSEEIFRKIFHVMNPGGILTTYCAKGVIRRMLQEIGFRCERLPGPPGGKREILRAAKPA